MTGEPGLEVWADLEKFVAMMTEREALIAELQRFVDYYAEHGPYRLADSESRMHWYRSSKLLDAMKKKK